MQPVECLRAAGRQRQDIDSINSRQCATGHILPACWAEAGTIDWSVNAVNICGHDMLTEDPEWLIAKVGGPEENTKLSMPMPWALLKAFSCSQTIQTMPPGGQGVASGKSTKVSAVMVRGAPPELAVEPPVYDRLARPPVQLFVGGQLVPAGPHIIPVCNRVQCGALAPQFTEVAQVHVGKGLAGNVLDAHGNDADSGLAAGAGPRRGGRGNESERPIIRRIGRVEVWIAGQQLAAEAVN